MCYIVLEITGIKNIHMAREPRGVVVPDDLLKALKKLVSELGESAARERVGLPAGTFARCLAGLTVYKGTIAIVRAALESAK